MVLPLGDIEKTRIVPIATYVLMALNIALYFVEQDLGETFQMSYAATPYEITHDVDIVEPFPTIEPEQVNGPQADPRPDQVHPPGAGPAPGPDVTVLTAMFLHASPLHLAGNMLFLWIFGDNVEEVLGTFRYILGYLPVGVTGTLAQILAAPDSLIPTLGASGAIAGVMGAYIIWFPHNRVRVLMFNFLTEMPAFVVIGVWILLQIAGGYGSIGQPRRSWGRGLPRPHRGGGGRTGRGLAVPRSGDRRPGGGLP